MKRRNRHLSIFTLSALDVLAMATGVFVLLLVMLMPYYRKIHDAGAAIEAVRSAESATIARVETLQAEATLYRGEAEAAEAEAARLSAAALDLERTAAEARRQVERATGAANPDRGGNVETPVIEKLDLVFVVDTTASMGPVLREIALTLRSVVRILESLVPSLRVGVVAYNDRDTGQTPVVTFPLTATDSEQGLASAIAFIEHLSASTVGSRTIDEDVHLGLQVAFAMPFRPDAVQRLVLVGDAAAHPPVVNQTFAWARQFVAAHKQRALSTLFVSTPTSRRYGDRDRGYFVALAQASGGEFNAHAGSMIESVLLSVLVE